MNYKSAKGAHLSDEQAQQYGEHIEILIQENNRQINPLIIVNDAKRKASPLHGFFEWDDSIAAKQYRVEQAKYLLRSIQVVVKVDDRKEEVRAFYNVNVPSETDKDSHERVYVQVERILTEQELRQQVVDQALQALICWKKKYQQYKEFTEVMKIIDKLAL